MSWRVYTWKLSQPSVREIAIAALQQLGIGYFQETDEGVEAYQEISESLLTTEDLAAVLPGIELGDFTVSLLENKNWNEEWERDYPDVRIGEFVRIRAPFHPLEEGFEHEILIHPRMAFGTGHHATTSGVIQLMKDLSFQGKTALDMGAGTAVLAILAEKLGAISVTAIDNDEWAYENGQTNITANKCQYTTYHLGGREVIAQLELTYDVIIGNINRNILLEQMQAYGYAAGPNARLLLSGFYTTDLEVICNSAATEGFRFLRNVERDSWCAAEFIKDE
jgi:ribosomal protein L11 methyltransferase